MEDKTIKVFVLQTVPNTSLQTIQLTLSSRFDVSAPTSRISTFLFIYIYCFTLIIQTFHYETIHYNTYIVVILHTSVNCLSYYINSSILVLLDTAKEI